MDGARQLERVVAAARADGEVLAVMLCGGRARGDDHAGSDVDVCIVRTAPAREAAALGRLALAYASLGELDVQVFQRLPLYVRHRLLKDGRVLDEIVFEAVSTRLGEFEEFRRHVVAAMGPGAPG